MAQEFTTDNFEAEVLKSEHPVLVDFWAEWCGPCKMMGPYVDKLAEEMDGQLKVVKLNTQDNTDTPSKYGITSIPTFLIIKDGEVKKQIIGGQRNYDAFKQSIVENL